MVLLQLVTGIEHGKAVDLKSALTLAVLLWLCRRFGIRGWCGWWFCELCFYYCRCSSGLFLRFLDRVDLPFEVRHRLLELLQTLFQLFDFCGWLGGFRSLRSCGSALKKTERDHETCECGPAGSDVRPHTFSFVNSNVRSSGV